MNDSVEQAEPEISQSTPEETGFQPPELPPIHRGDPRRQQMVLNLQRRYGNAFTQRVLQRASARPSIQRVPHGTRPDAPAPEQTSVAITGGYEALNPGGSNRITLQINQAGHHFEGWYQRRAYSGAWHRQSMQQHRLAGELIRSTPNETVYSYHKFYENGREIDSGQMTFNNPATPNGHITMQMANDSGWSHGFEKVSNEARPPDVALSGAPQEIRDVLVASINAPLDRDENQRLVRSCEQLHGLIHQYLNASGMMRTAISTQINQFVGNMMTTYAEQQIPLVLRRIREELTTTRYQAGNTTRPYWEWLQIVVVEQPGFTPILQSRFGFRPDGADGREHRYRYMIAAVGPSGDIIVGGQVMVGQLTIEKLGPDTWRQNYFIGFVGFSGGLSVGSTGAQVSNWSEFQTPFNWAPGNFNGWFAVTGVTGSASFGGGGGYSPGGVMVMYGDGSLSPLAISADGLMIEWGVHAGVELGVQAGYIGGGRQQVITQVRPPQAAQHSGAYQTGTTVHFAVDDPSLTPEGHAAVRQMVALHLRALEDPNSTLRIDGYTSTTGSTSRNQTLSDLRAHNTLQAIIDSAGSRFRVGNVEAIGHGETPARNAGVPDNTEDASWRKVEVRLNGRVVIVLHY